jgi:hypothetical protein
MKEPKKEATTAQQRYYEICVNCCGTFNTIYDTDRANLGFNARSQKKVYVLTPEEIQRIKDADPRLYDINSVGLRNMWIKFLKKKGYVKTKRSPLTYTYIPEEESTQIIDGKKYLVTMKRLT